MQYKWKNKEKYHIVIKILKSNWKIVEIDVANT
jgi:hypothetical protein